MRKLVLVAHVSLDGFVAGTKGELDGFEASDENLDFVFQLTTNADAAVFGRISYELLNKFWPIAKDRPNATKSEIAFSNWYNHAQKIVISKTMKDTQLNNTVILHDNIATEINKIREQEGKDLLIFGSPSIAQLCMQLDLIDSYWIFINPVIFGQGIPLFVPPANKANLKLLSTKQFMNGEIALNYIVERD